MGQLHDRMAEDLTLRNFSPATRRVYLIYARKFAAFYMRSPEELGAPEIRRFLLHQTRRLSASLCGLEVSLQCHVGTKLGSRAHSLSPPSFDAATAGVASG